MVYAKLDAKGSVQTWCARVDDDATMHISWGKHTGKMQQKERRYTKGKNVGRKNATTPLQQALAEMKSLESKNIDKGYVLVPENTDDITQFVKDNQTVVPRPMLAHAFADYDTKLPHCWLRVQPKLDGIRCVANTVTGKMYSRSGKEITSLPHITDEIISWRGLVLGKMDEWYDGELYVHGMDFQTIMSIVSTKSVHKRSREIEYHVYDAIDTDSEFPKRFHHCGGPRMYHLNGDVVNDTPSVINIKKVETFRITRDQIQEHHAAFLAAGYEGTMIRWGVVGYEIGKRSKHLLKCKDFKQEEFKIIGFESESFQEDRVGAVKLTDGEHTFNARPAIQAQAKVDMWNNQDDYIGKMATVKFFEKTTNGIPRFPVMLGVREDFDL